MTVKNEKPLFVFRSFVNSYHYLYQDAECLRQIAHKSEIGGAFESVRLCRTALLLYVLSLEGLINRALGHFLPEHLREFFLEREDRFRLEDKWLLLPLLASDAPPATFDRSQYPWSHFVELVQIRNEFVHPKAQRPAYYRAITSHRWEPLPWKDIPGGLSVKETDVIYRQTRIPRDPYVIRAEHVDEVKRVVDDVVARLDELLDRKLSKDDWLRNDQMTLVYPPGATLSDLAALDSSPPDPPAPEWGGIGERTTA